MIVLTLVRLAVAALVPLAPDETYYWVWSQALAAGYVDHPPMVALWIRIGTALAGDEAFGIRVLGPLSAAFGSLMLADAADRMLPRRGAMAAWLLNATLLFGVGSVIMTPDTPLLFFWTAALWAAVRGWRTDRAGWWLLTGLFAGLALMSKYTAVFLWLGLFLWVLWVPSLRRRLRRPEPWAGAAIGIGVFLPVVWWNAAHGWASFLRQGGRVGDWRPVRAIGFLGELAGSQAGLVTPLVFLLCVVGVAAATRTAWRTREAAPTLLAALTAPAALVFLQHALGDRVQGNWPAIIYPAACIAAAGLTAPRWVALQRPALVLGLAVTALVYLQAATGILPLPPRLDPIALQLRGWQSLASEVEAARLQTGATFVVADQYALASELAHDLPPGVMVLAAGDRWTLTTLPPANQDGATGLLIRNVRRSDPIDPLLWRDPVAVTEAPRGLTETFRFYRVTASPALTDVVRLPRPIR